MLRCGPCSSPLPSRQYQGSRSGRRSGGQFSTRLAVPRRSSHSRGIWVVVVAAAAAADAEAEVEQDEQDEQEEQEEQDDQQEQQEQQ